MNVTYFRTAAQPPAIRVERINTFADLRQYIDAYCILAGIGDESPDLVVKVFGTFACSRGHDSVFAESAGVIVESLGKGDAAVVRADGKPARVTDRGCKPFAALIFTEQ